MYGAKYTVSTPSDTSATAGYTGAIAASDPPLYDTDPAQKLVDRHRALRYPYFCTFGQARLEIAEGVFCPTHTKTSPLLLEALTFQPGQRVLDVFAGSGAFGINAALHGASAVLVDVSPLAVACATRNAALNSVEDRVAIRQGTMGECITPDETFDLIVANPPLLPGQQTDELSRAIFDPGLSATVDFIRRVGCHLKPNGRCYLVTSNVIERYRHDLDRLFADSNLYSMLVHKLDAGYETYQVHQLKSACNHVLMAHRRMRDPQFCEEQVG